MTLRHFILLYFFCPFRALFPLLLDLLLEDLDVVCQAGDGGLEGLFNGYG